MSEILINGYEYGRYYIRKVQGEEEYQIYEEKRGTKSFLGIYTHTLEEAAFYIAGLVKEKMDLERTKEIHDYILEQIEKEAE